MRLDHRQREALRLHLAIAPARVRAASRCGRPRTTPGSWRSRPRPSCRFRRSARARATTERGRAHRGTGQAPCSAPDRRGLELARGAFGIGGAEDGVAGDQNARARRRRLARRSSGRCRRRFRSAPRVAGAVEQRAHRPHLCDSLRGMNAWPPKPGLTDITSTKSTSAAISSSATTGVAGLSTTPALTPSALIGVDGAVQVRQHLDVHRDHRRRRPRRTPRCSGRVR